MHAFHHYRELRGGFPIFSEPPCGGCCVDAAIRVGYMCGHKLGLLSTWVWIFSFLTRDIQDKLRTNPRKQMLIVVKLIKLFLRLLKVIIRSNANSHGDLLVFLKFRLWKFKFLEVLGEFRGYRKVREAYSFHPSNFRQKQKNHH